MWIDGTNKHGFITIAGLVGQKSWYFNSSVYWARLLLELRIFNPRDLGLGAQGTTSLWNIAPTYSQLWTLPYADGQNPRSSLNALQGEFGLCGASYDSTLGRIYAYIVNPNNANNGNGYIYVFSVNS
jgi:hypothetical protein